MVRKDKPQPGTSSTEIRGTAPTYDDSKFVAAPVTKGRILFLKPKASAISCVMLDAGPGCIHRFLLTLPLLNHQVKPRNVNKYINRKKKFQTC